VTQRGRGSKRGIEIKRLDSGYLHARGNGPCEWAQWPEGREPTERDFFPEASESFRRALAVELLARTRKG
jgi:hypothetical protein